MAPQVAFSVNSVSVIYLRRMLILGSSNRGGVLACTRYTPYTLTLVEEEEQPVSYLYPLYRKKKSMFLSPRSYVFQKSFFVYYFSKSCMLIVFFRDEVKCEFKHYLLYQPFVWLNCPRGCASIFAPFICPPSAHLPPEYWKVGLGWLPLR